MAKGSLALKEDDFSEATDCFSRALEIRVMQRGELATECVKAYYKYGYALLYKAQEEADPLGAVPKKEGGSVEQGLEKDASLKNVVNGESSTASVSSNAEQGASSDKKEQAGDDDSDGKDQEDEDSDVED